MDLGTVTSYREATSRAELALGPGERLIAGGTWMFSEPQPDVTGLVDLTSMGWPTIEHVDGGVRIGATCTIAELAGVASASSWRAAPLVTDCANALLASFKVWNAATVGGNICRAYAAAAIVALAVTLDAEAEVWRADGTNVHKPVVDLVAGNGLSTLSDGDVLRAITIPAHALEAQTASRKIALAEHGRSGALLTGRRDAEGTLTFVITAATSSPTVLRFAAAPTAAELLAAVNAASGYYTDAFGAADWRRQVSGVLLNEVREDLAQ